jgi:hypothetical protein
MGERNGSILDSIRELKSRDPFAPFAIVMASGDRYVIEAAANLVELKTELFYAFPKSDRFVLMMMSQIVSVERGEGRRPARRRSS